MATIETTCIHCGENNFKDKKSAALHESICILNPIAARVRISERYTVHVKKFNATAVGLDVRFGNTRGVTDLNAFLSDNLQYVLNKGLPEADNDTLCGIEITHPGLTDSILHHFCPRKDINVKRVIELVESVMQSNEAFTLDENTVWHFVSVKLPCGGSRRKRRVDLESWVTAKSGKNGPLFLIPGDDNYCLPKAIVTGKARIHRKDDKGGQIWNNVRERGRNRYSKQESLARQLVFDAGLQNHEGQWGIPEVAAFDRAIGPDYQIRVFSSDEQLSCIYPAAEDLKPKYYIDLLLHNNHYDLITSIASFLGSSYYCNVCRVAYHNKRRHTDCGHTCRCCYGTPPCDLVEWKYCNDCNRFFLNDDCFDRHQAKTVNTVRDGRKRRKIETSICENIKNCKTCKKKMRAERNEIEEHKCGYYKCALCKDLVTTGHKCFMTPHKIRQKDTSFIFFDFEATQDEEKSKGKFLHKVNLAYVQKCCDDCYELPDDKPCARCRDREKTFIGGDCIAEFCKWLFSEQNNNCVGFAHNLQGYDGQFILEWLEKNAHTPKVILKGRKIVKLECNNITLLDSLNFLPFPLASIPKAFGFKEEKGFFPHFFNKMSNLDYIGAYPEAKYYGPETMKNKETFYEWYESVRHDEFNFREQLKAYCKQDVVILKQGCMKFRQLVMSEFELDPFINSATTPAMCMAIYRHHFLKKNSIAIVPNGGYRKEDRQSAIAIRWMQYISETENIDIQHARNGGEVRIGTLKVDGQDKNNPTIIFEYYGCAFHGCLKCFPNRNQKLPLSDQTARSAHLATLDREKTLRQQGYLIRSMWECQLQQLMSKDPNMKAYFAQRKAIEPMDPREAFYGGRTCSMKMICTPKEDEYIGYVDVCSLYPWVCKYAKFPVGHPEIITENFKPITASEQPYFGIIKCLIRPPRGLFHPILPMRGNSNLLFTLCAKCAIDENDNECTHVDEDRQFWGAWCTPELQKALEHGYVLIEVSEVYHFKESSQYDGKDLSTGLFTPYINAFLKLKQQASGWPEWVKTHADEERYIRQYETVEGIQLEKDKIEKNPALRSLAKLGLNSFWGKFGQRNNLTKTEYVRTNAALLAILTNPTLYIQHIQIITSETIAVQYKKIDDFVEDVPNSNVIIAAFVTTYARLKLYDYLYKLGKNALYCDTDSVIFLGQPGSYIPPTGDFLGDMTDELGIDDIGQPRTIREFVSTGPKAYAFITTDNKRKMKIKGFSLGTVDCNPSLDGLKQHVYAYVEGHDPGEVFKRKAITRGPGHKIYTQEQTKTLQARNTKCRVLPDFTTLPYGY